MGWTCKKIAIKISKASGIIFKLNDVLPYNVLITLYNARADPEGGVQGVRTPPPFLQL